MPNEQPKPRFTHDCDRCRFLGQIGDRDMYSCPQNGFPTIISRFGDAGPDYSSCPLHLLRKMESVESLTPDIIAMLLAVARLAPTANVLNGVPEKE